MFQDHALSSYALTCALPKVAVEEIGAQVGAFEEERDELASKLKAIGRSQAIVCCCVISYVISIIVSIVKLVLYMCVCIYIYIYIYLHIPTSSRSRTGLLEVYD